VELDPPAPARQILGHFPTVVKPGVVAHRVNTR
jgi:hypothetical protein